MNFKIQFISKKWVGFTKQSQIIHFDKSIKYTIMFNIE